MKRGFFLPLSMALLFCIARPAGATLGARFSTIPKAPVNPAAAGGLHGALAAADDTKEPPKEEDPAGELERELNALIEELKRLGRDAGKAIEEDVLPRIREEIQKLRKKLREFDSEKKQPETRET